MSIARNKETFYFNKESIHWEDNNNKIVYVPNTKVPNHTSQRLIEQKGEQTIVLS